MLLSLRRHEYCNPLFPSEVRTNTCLIFAFCNCHCKAFEKFMNVGKLDGFANREKQTQLMNNLFQI